MSGKWTPNTPHTLDRLVMVANYMQRIYDEGEGGRFTRSLEILKVVTSSSFDNLQKGRVVMVVGELNERPWQDSNTSMAYHL